MTDLATTKMNKPKGIPVSKIPTSGRDSGTHSRSSSISNITTASDIHSEAGDIVSESYDFKIDDKVWVNGTKPGIVKFIGKTEFAPGMWVGVCLDEATGKNDGSVAGKKYFPCKPQHGIFARPNKVAKSPGTGTGDSASVSSIGTPKLQSSNLSSRTVTPTAPSSASKGGFSKLKYGDRVVVNSSTGTKLGTLKFIGETEFAKGEWAGIELDEPVGKNDGSVAGKRYFTCEMKYGLFSPLHKVSRAGGTLSRTNSVRGTPLVRSGSKDSVSSSVSNASRSSRVKLGVTSLTSTQKLKSPGLGFTINSSALEESLKEKEQHIEQLLKERDIEKLEVTKASEHFKEIEMKYTELKQLQQKADQDKKVLENELSSVKRKLEDLQFLLDEEKITKNDLEMQVQQKNAILKRLDEFISGDVDKFTNIKEILECKENLSEVHKKQEVNQEFEVVKSESLEVEKKLKDLLEDKNKLITELEIVQQRLKEAEEKNKSISDALNNTIQEKDDIISSLKSELNSQLEKVTSLIEDNKNLNEEVISQAEQAKGQADNVIKELGEKITSLTEEIKTKSVLLDENVACVQSKDDKIISLQKDLEIHSAQLVEFENENKNLKQLLEQKGRELEEKMTGEKAVQDDLTTLKSNLESEISKKEEKILGLVKEIEQLTNSLQEKEEDLILKQKETDSLNATVNQTKLTIDNLKEKLHQADTKLALIGKDNSEKVNELLEEVNQLKQEKECIVNEYEGKLQQEQEELNKKICELEAAINSISKQKSELMLLNEELANRNQESVDLTTKLEETMEACKKLTDENEQLIISFKEKDQNISDLKKQIEDLRSLLDKNTKEKEEKEHELLSRQSILKSKEEENAALSSKLQLAEQKVEMLNKDSSEHVMSLQTELSRLKEANLTLKSDLEQEIGKLRTENEAKLANINELSKHLKDKESTLQSVENTLKEKEAEISQLSIKMQTYEKEILSFKEEKEREKVANQQKLNTVVKECEKEIEKKEQILKDTQAKLTELTELVEAKTQELQLKNDDIQKLKNALKEKDSQFDELSLMITASQTQLQLMKEQNEKNVALLESKESLIKEFKAEQEKLFQQKEQELNEKVIKFHTVVQAKENIINEKEQIITKLASQEEQQKAEILALKSQLEEVKAEREKMSQDSSKVYEEFSIKIADMEKKYLQLMEEKDKIAMEERKNRDARKSLEEVCQSLRQEKMSQEGVVKDRETKLEALQTEVNRMQAQFAQHKEELQQKLDVSESELQAALELKKELEVQHSVLEELQQDLMNSENKCKQLELKVQEMPTIISEKDKLQDKIKDIEKVCQEKQERIMEIEQKNQSLEEKMSNIQNLLVLKETELTELNEKLQNLQKKTEPAGSLQLSLKTMEEENLSLKKKIESLEKALSDKGITTSAGANINEMNDDEEKESLKSQIDFLNSIIVDMRQKNEDLAKQLEIQSTCWEESDLNQNDSAKKLAPRLFCDICDMFDLHDTEDCPKQESYVQDEGIPHLIPQGIRKLDERPYCNNCEVFGHWTLDCSEPETF